MTFEHIHKLSTCLHEVSKLLNPGGHLYAYFTSCWMGRHGHHWSRVRNLISSANHLIYTESEMRSLLILAEVYLIPTLTFTIFIVDQE